MPRYTMGRHRVYASAADRQHAFRQRRAAELERLRTARDAELSALGAEVAALGRELAAAQDRIVKLARKLQPRRSRKSNP